VWYHLQCLPTFLRDGARKSITAATSCAKQVYAAIFNLDVLLPTLIVCYILMQAAITIDFILRIF